MKGGVFVTVCLVLLCTNGSAQPSLKELQISNKESLWQIAVANNSNLKVYSLKKEQSLIDGKTAESYRYPQASGSFSGQDNLKLSLTPVPGKLVGQPGKTVYLQFGKYYTYNTGLTFSVSIFDKQQVVQSKITKQNILTTEAEQQTFEQTLKTQITQAYYTLLVAQLSLITSQRDLVLADTVVEINKQKFQQGLIDAIAINQSSINHNAIEQNIYQSKLLFQQSLAIIKNLAGIDEKTTITFSTPSSLETIYSDEKITSLGQDKSLLIYPINQKTASLQTQYAQAAFYPKLSATGYWGFQQYRDFWSMSFDKGSWSDYQYVGVNLSVPLFTGFANSNKLKSTQVQQKIIEEQYKSAMEQSKVNDKELQEAFINYKAITITSKKTFDLYGKNLELSLQKFKEGLISMDVYLKTFQDYLMAENSFLSNLSNLLSVQATFDARK